MEMVKLREISRYGVCLGSLGFMIGAVIIILGHPVVGEVSMIVGGVVLFAACSVLANLPTGDKDAG